jgi:tungstate transport system substrate-binding protein
MKRRFLSAVAVAMLVAGLMGASASADTIRVQSTTDTIDAGLVDDLLKPLYAQAQPGDTLQYVGVGTGRALDNARNGLADVVITHAPSLERQFVTDGFSLEPSGRAIFYSDYVIVGPRGDPAGVGTTAPHDAIGAFEAIAAAGGGGRATFISRGDNSGTNVQEQIMWGTTTGVPIERSRNAGTATDRFEPSSGGVNPAWYRTTIKGQAANLQETDVCSTVTYPDGGCYTMVDRGTFNRLLNSGTITNLAIVSQINDAGARGGKDLLINPFSVYIVNPDKVRALTTVNVPAAERFVDFLASPSFQSAVDVYPTTTDPAFHADAFPRVTLTSPLPTSASAGAHVTLSLNLANRQPGTPAVSGMPVQLQQSTDGGAHWSELGAVLATDASGNVTFTPEIARTTAYRVSLQRFQATDWNAFSPNMQALGVVSVATAAPAPRPLDHTAPRLSDVVLGRRSLTLRISEPAKVKATIAKRVVRRVRRPGHVRRIVTFRTVRVVRVRATSAGRVTLRWARALPAGRYRVGVRATDAAHNVRIVRVSRTIHRSARHA